MTIINMNGNDEIAGEIGLPMDGFFSGHAEEAINMADELIQGWFRKKAALLLALYLGIIRKRSLENYIYLCKPDGYSIEQSGLYHIDSACGRVHAQMYKAAGPLKTAVFDTAKDLFPEKANFNERYKTDSFRESCVGFAANTTYSQTMDYINRHVAEAEKFSSAHYFHSLLQNEGDSLAEAMDSLVGKALDESIFDSETLQPEGPPQLAPASAADPLNVFAEAAELGLKIDKINLMDCENPDETIYASVDEILAEAQIRKPGDKAEKLENVAPEAENAEEPAFGKCQSAESAESAESDGSSTEPNAEIGKNSDESPFSCGGAGQEAAERLLKAFYSVELDSRSRKDSCDIISCALDQALPEIGKEDEEKRKIELKRIKEEDEAKKKKNGGKKSGFRKHAVVRAASEGKAYAIINESIFGALRIFPAFLTCNALLGRKGIIFLFDGENSIRGNILKIFSFLGSTAIILDYKHAIIKATQLLSSSINDRNAKAQILKGVKSGFGLATLREFCCSCHMFLLISSNAKKNTHP